MLYPLPRLCREWEWAFHPVRIRHPCSPVAGRNELSGYRKNDLVFTVAFGIIRIISNNVGMDSGSEGGVGPAATKGSPDTVVIDPSTPSLTCPFPPFPSTPSSTSPTPIPAASSFAPLWLSSSSPSSRCPPCLSSLSPPSAAPSFPLAHNPFCRLICRPIRLALVLQKISLQRRHTEFFLWDRIRKSLRQQCQCHAVQRLRRMLVIRNMFLYRRWQICPVVGAELR